MSTFSFETIKALAKQLGWKVEDLLALADKNDPFYVGRPAQRAAGEWFAGLWERFRFPRRNAHLRRVHYVLISQKAPLLLPDGKLYLNTEGAWDALNEASKAARYLGLVPLEAIEDRRNPPPQIFAPEKEERSRFDDEFYEYVSEGFISGVSLRPTMPDYALPSYAVTGSVEQRYHIELWCEKSTMNDVLVPLCRRNACNLVTGLGEMSIPAVRDLILRIARIGKPSRVLYISDFDPGGQSMPVAVARKAEWLIARDGLGVDLRLLPIVLTPDQIAKYNLPRTPIKDSELRKASFEQRHGAGATELDALEALHPGALGQIVGHEIERYRDDTLQRRFEQERAAVMAKLLPVQEEVHAAHEASVGALRGEYEEIVERLDAWKEHADQVQKAIEADLNARMPRSGTTPVPQPVVADEPQALFDSRRPYAEQLFAYKRHKNGSNGRDNLIGELRLCSLTAACQDMGVDVGRPDGDRDQIEDEDDDL